MSVSRRLQIPTAADVVVLGRPQGVDLEIPTDCLVTSDPADAPGAVVIAFVTSSEQLEDLARPSITAAREDRLAWIAYPKARQLGTDLTRDVLVALLASHGIQPVRAVSVDGVWSALRFRPA